MLPFLLWLLSSWMILMLESTTAEAVVEPLNGPPQMLSRMPYEATATQSKFHLDEFENFRINTDASGQLQNEEMVCVSPVFYDEVVAVWRDFRFGYRRVGFGYSMDFGRTWQDDVFPQMYFPMQSDPVLVVDADGVFTAMVISYNPGGAPGSDGLLTVRSTNGGYSWQDSLFAIGYDPAAFEDKEMLAVDRSDSPYRGSLYCVWTRFFGYPNTDSTHIALVRKRADSSAYTPPVYVSQTSSNQWANVIVGAEGEVYVSWVSYPYQAVMFSKSLDGGITFSPEEALAYTGFRSANINGGILIFSYGAMAVDESDGPYRGRLYLVYTDTRPDLSETDIWLMFSDDGGENWTPKLMLNDENIDSPVDQFHPWLTVDPLGRVWVAFYDRRNDPENYLFDLYFTASSDGGQSWINNQRVTTESSDPQAGSRAGLLGEYIGLCASEAHTHIVWTDTRLGDQDVFGTVIDSVFLAAEPVSPVPPLPEEPTLTVFPNPGNSAFQLQYNLPQAGPVNLSLYNVLGQQVWSKPQGNQIAGLHQTKLDLSNMATGLYIAKLESRSGVAFTKLFLAK
ncbi:T9SS type A sorting domain-containing protein [bacterium]|nr:T9SS type A sorting domain-containing protein [bacterium]